MANPETPAQPPKQPRVKQDLDKDPELNCMSACLKALAQCPPEGRQRVMQYLVSKFCG